MRRQSRQAFSVLGAGQPWSCGRVRPMSQEARLRQLEFETFVRYPPIHTIYEFAFQHTRALMDRLADLLALTPQERATLESSAPLPSGFILERWGQFDRWRIRWNEGGRVREESFDQVPDESPDYVEPH